jgi:hypothetical protein
MKAELKNVVCPQCKQEFRLMWNDYEKYPQSLIIRACPSGGVYDVSILCPNCDYEEEL